MDQSESEEDNASSLETSDRETSLESSSTSEEEESNTGKNEPVAVRTFVRHLASDESSSSFSEKEQSSDSGSNKEQSSDSEVASVDSIEEDFNYSINRFCDDEPSTYLDPQENLNDCVDGFDEFIAETSSTSRSPRSSSVRSDEGNNDVHYPAKRVRLLINDKNSNDSTHTSSDDEASSTTTFSSGESSSDLQSDVETHNCSASSTSESDQEEYNAPLFDGSSVTAKNFSAMFFALTHKHNLSSQATDSILKLIKLSLPEGNKCPASGYQFEKSLLDLGYQFKKHVTCWKCQHPLVENDTCPNDDCINVGTGANGEESSMFYIIDLLPELERLISEHWNEMKDFTANFVHQPGVYRDIMDGSIYREHSTIIKESGFFPITLYWHLDGAPALKSKSMSLWPIQSFVAELPLNLRYSYKNILLSGLWYGKKKPNMQVFQDSFVNQVVSLSDGFQFPDMCTPIFKLTTNGQAADLVAKGPSLNFKLFCGKWGCSVCLHPGRRLPGRGNRRIYSHFSTPFPRRNHTDSNRHAQLAEETKEPVFGIMGTSPVHSIMKIPDMLLLDYMHQVLEGEYTRRFSKWLGGSCPGDVKLSKVDQANISQQLKSVKLPHDFKRKFRPMEEFSKWKASEKGALFHHAGLPILKLLLPAEHFYHHSLLVTGIRILCEDEITDRDIDIADAMLSSYARLLPTLFDESECTYNSHSLTHFPEQVRTHGPLILHSTFVFESMLAHLKHLSHGSRGISDQICRKLGAIQHANHHIRKDVQGNDAAMEFADNLMAPVSKSANVVQLENGVQFLPPFKKAVPHTAFPIDDFFGDRNEISTCQRMKKNGQVYHSLNYVRKKNSASYLIQFEDPDMGEPNFGAIHYFVKHGNEGHAVVNILRNMKVNVCQRGLASPKDPVIKEFLSSGVLGYHFIGVKQTRSFRLIRCDQITARIIFVKSDSADVHVDGYVSAVLKSYQHD